MRIRIDNRLRIADTPEALRTEICSRLTITNPKWTENERMGRFNGKTYRLLRFYESDGTGGLITPRGFAGQLVSICRGFSAPFEIDDHRRELPPVEFGFTGKLRSYQRDAVDDVLLKHFGTLTAPTGSGKTIIALAIIAQRRQPALVVVHTKELLTQWKERIQTFLGIPEEEIGVIGGGKKVVGSKITVATVQSLVKCAGEVAPYIGHIVVDECHRTPSKTFSDVVTGFDCKFMLGLSATPYRRDKLSRLIFWHLGDIQHRVDAERLVAEGSILQAEVITRETDFRPFSDPSAEYSKMLSELTQDDKRNHLIAGDIAQQAQEGNGICLALSDRKGHCEALQSILQNNHGIEAELLTGDTPHKDRQAIVERLNAGDVKVLVATGQLIGEGFDCKGLSTLFLATPVKFSGRLLQYVGRILRPGPGKQTPKVYDYIDRHVGPLVAAARARRRVYDQAA
ncbi:hypothetical protein DSCO28_30370 [Desulfosarcina ovata subsp. sediminis]|uniref:Helicase n=1 Tax=Desulfosarcina ovata subsp. sediminis TaxID=885957 RepID=A0A5K7ZMY5_9BACT|nr:DEAD/DEAH box helicase [Desulfosarcina ovata]BBO82471.1 hypothetical protein DSCO28_30370 [Desulfosarcina ovata subsp. sediminis]